MNDLGIGAYVGNVKGDGTLYAVEVVIKSRLRPYKQRCGHSSQVQAICQFILEVILDFFNSSLSLQRVQDGFIILR